ncbi:MAG: hypothetical protein LUO82_03700 [Methanomicrobiales archaeon]|nr:hypothetical protein [Methanomicrobiales archaeon]
MKRPVPIILYGVLIWLIPFLAGFPFVDATGTFLIPETFFKSIMVVIGAFVGVLLAVRYFSTINAGQIKEGIIIGMSWLAINLALDLLMVFVGFFPMTVLQYITEIGLRYVSIPIYTVGLGIALERQQK